MSDSGVLVGRQDRRGHVVRRGGARAPPARPQARRPRRHARPRRHRRAADPARRGDQADAVPGRPGQGVRGDPPPGRHHRHRRPERTRARRPRPVGSVDRAQIEAACPRASSGRIKQVPPMYSAVHHRASDSTSWRRQGVEVEREPREVVIHAIDGARTSPARAVRLRSCAARAPTCARWPPIWAPRWAAARRWSGWCARAWGRSRSSRRRAVGGALDRAAAPALWARVQPPAARWPGWPAVRLDARATERFEHGQPVDVAPAGAAERTLVRVHAGRRPAARGRARSCWAGDRPGRCGSFMRIVRGLESFPPDARPSVVALGTFDGVHLGHRAILGTAVTRARAAGLQAVACTFEPHPTEILQPDARARAPSRPLEERLALIAETGVDGVVVLAFTPRAGRRRAGGLREGRAARAPAGARGRRRASTIASGGGPAAMRGLLQELAARLGFRAHVRAAAARSTGSPVSSTRDPRGPAAGRRRAAARLLGPALLDRGAR